MENKSKFLSYYFLKMELHEIVKTRSSPYKNMILLPPNILDHNYGSIYVFSRAKVFGKFSLHNRKIQSADVKKTQIPQNL